MSQLMELCSQLREKGELSSSDIYRVNQAIQADQSDDGLEALGSLIQELIEGRVRTTSPTARMYLLKESQIQSHIQQAISTGHLSLEAYHQINGMMWAQAGYLMDGDLLALAQLSELIREGRVITDVPGLFSMVQKLPHVA